MYSIRDVQGLLDFHLDMINIWDLMLDGEPEGWKSLIFIRMINNFY